MTAHLHHGKPRYREVGDFDGFVDQASCPPFLFREVTSRVFPIPANIARLATFCDQYLNLDVPTTLVQFRPSLPYVYLMVINYGSMSAESVRAQNFGWVAQREVTFTVPLERWVRDPVTDAWRFLDWACVSPFIFVDDPMSLGTGREVYGWPKMAAQVDADVPLWATDPRAPTRLFSLRTAIFPRLYHGAREVPRVLLEVERDSVPRFSEVPPDPANPWNPAAILASATRNTLSLMGAAADLLLRSPARGYRHGWTPATAAMMSRAAALNLSGFLPRGDDTLAERVGSLLGGLLGGAAVPDHGIDRCERGLGIDMITLKQFRDSDDPTQACYQALVRSRMTIDRINHCGLLGDYNLLRGDTSGGYAIRIHRYAAQPIIDCLGLAVTRTEAGGEAPVAILKPTFPFWTDVDLRYGVGETLCWRAQCAHPDGHCTHWHRGDAPADGGAAHPPPASARPAPDTGQRIPYNTLQGAATQAITGPFEFSDLTLQVYPLAADQHTLRSFIDEYLNRTLADTGTADSQHVDRFEAFGPYVYLLIASPGADGSMWSETNDIGSWADKDVSFCVPVRHYRRAAATATAWDFRGIGIVAPFVFANSSRAVISDREVNGRPSVQADIAAPRDPWLETAGPIAQRHLVTVSTEMFPALYVGQRAEPETLLEIREHDPQDPAAAPAPRASGRRRTAPAEHRAWLRRWLEAHVPGEGATPSGSAVPELSRFHLKQYRDATHADRACYQALVETVRKLQRLAACGPIMQRLEVRLSLAPAYPIADILGLKVNSVVATPDGVMQLLAPRQPFWLQGSLREELGTTLCWRTERGPWNPMPSR